MALVATGLLPEGGSVRHHPGRGDGPAVVAGGTGGGHRRPGDALLTSRGRCSRWPPARSRCRPAPEPSGQLRPAAHAAVQHPRQHPAVVAGVSLGRRPVGVVRQVARRLDDLAGRHDPAHDAGVAPSRRPSVDRSGVFSRPGTSAAVTASQCSDPGCTTDAVPAQVTRRPPLSLLRSTTSTRAPSSMSGSGCSSPPETTQSASSCQTCQTACARPAWRIQETPVFFASSAIRASCQRLALGSVTPPSLPDAGPGQ